MRLRPLDPLIRHLIRRMAAPLFITPAAHPDDNRQQLLLHNSSPRPSSSSDSLLLPNRRPDIQIQTVLTLRVRVLELRHQLPVHACPIAAVLHADGLIGLCVSDAVVGGAKRGHEAKGADGGLGEGDAEPLRDEGGVGGVDEARVGAGGGGDGEEGGGFVEGVGVDWNYCAGGEKEGGEGESHGGGCVRRARGSNIGRRNREGTLIPQRRRSTFPFIPQPVRKSKRASNTRTDVTSSIAKFEIRDCQASL